MLKEKLLLVVKSPAVRKAALALLLAALTAAGLSLPGCGVFSAKSPALDVFECRARVLAPYVADAAPQVVAAVHAGDLNPVALLLSLGLTPEEIVSIARAYSECAPPAVPVQPEAPADAGLIRS